MKVGWWHDGVIQEMLTEAHNRGYTVTDLSEPSGQLTSHLSESCDDRGFRFRKIDFWDYGIRRFL